MRILLIEPPFERLKGIGANHFPIGLGYLAAVLNKQGYYVRIYNSELVKKDEATISKLLEIHERYIKALKNKNHYVWKEILSTLKNFKPDIVGITVKTCKLPSALKVASLSKQYNKNCIVIVGGQHATLLSDELLVDRNVDFAMRGEAEETIVELVNAIENKLGFDNIKGISFKKDNKIIHNQQRELIKDLDKLPFPARELSLPTDKYGEIELGHMITMRGCPYRCAYCSARAIWGKTVRVRSIKNVIGEIKYLMNKYQLKTFYFLDDTFTINKNRVRELCKAIIKEKLKIRWGCSTRINLIEDSLLKIMKKAGCNKIDIGIESGSEKILELIKKDINLEQMREAARLFKKNGVDWHAFIMIGMPNETKEDIYKTINFVTKELKPSTLIFSIFTPYPGTELYDLTRELNLLPKKPNWALYSHQSPKNYFTNKITREEFKKIVVDISRRVDKYNNRLRALISRAMAKKDYFARHPVVFLKKSINLIATRLNQK